MRWLKRSAWKMGIAITSILLLLLVMEWIRLSVADAHKGTSGLATPGTVTVQATPTEDATVTALNKEKLQHENDWWWNYGATILTSLISTLTLAAAGIFTVVRYFNDRRDTREKQEAEAERLAEDRKAERERRDEEQRRWLKDQEVEREKRAEERFQAAVEGLSSEREEAKIGAAILLRTFLHPGYEQFYIQTFDLAVANLRLPRTSDPSEDSQTPLPLTTLSQALIVVFKEAFPLARDERKQHLSSFNPRLLDASRIQLDRAYLAHADLDNVWMPEASLRKTNFGVANLRNANMRSSNLAGAHLGYVHINGANLRRTNLSGANFHEADLSETDLYEADLSEADLSGANLREANIEKARSLKNTNLQSAQGLTKEQRASCKAKGALIDEHLTSSAPQSTVVPPLLSQRSDLQAQSAPSTQGSVPPLDPGESGTVS